MRLRAPAIPIIFSCLVLAGLMLALGDCVQEDAFISFRYAANLVDGNGLVYNPGERVEGYTNFLWTAMIAGGLALGAAPGPLVRILGLLATAGLLAWILRTARRHGDGHRWAGATALVLLAGTPGLAAEGVQGLETVWFALLVAVGTTLAVKAFEAPAYGRPHALAALAAAVLALAALTRPEGVGVFLLVTMAALFARRADARRILPRLLTSTAVFALVYLPYWWLRYDYYGFPLPNTFYAKTGGGLDHLLRGLVYLGRFLLHHPALVVLSAASVAALRGVREGSRRPALVVPLAVVVGYLGYVALVGGDFKATWRFVLPVLPLWVLLVDAWAARALARVRWSSAVAVGVLTAVLLVNAAPTLPGAVGWSRQRARDLERRTTCGEWLRENAPPDAVMAIHSAGIVPYVSGLRTIDMWGLNDLHIAHRIMPDMGRIHPQGHEKADYSYVLEREPDYILPRTWDLVTLEPVSGIGAKLFKGIEAWADHADRYGERSVKLPPVPGSDAPRWFNFLEKVIEARRR